MANSSLDLSFHEIGDEGAQALAASPHLSALDSLSLGLNGIGRETAAVVLRRWPFATIEER